MTTGGQEGREQPGQAATPTRENGKTGPFPPGKDGKAGPSPAGEIGGPAGPEPTRYGDWERNGIASDF